jgi:hypothetical protein
VSTARPRRDRAPRPPRTTIAAARPGAVEVRLVGLPDVMDVLMASLAGHYGDAWQPRERKPSLYAEGHVRQYGTLIIPAGDSPAGPLIPPESAQQEAGRKDTARP